MLCYYHDDANLVSFNLGLKSLQRFPCVLDFIIFLVFLSVLSEMFGLISREELVELEEWRDIKPRSW